MLFTFTIRNRNLDIVFRSWYNISISAEKSEKASLDAKVRFGKFAVDYLFAPGGNMSTRFIIVRHGQSLGNAKHIFLGHTDWDLSELGYRQAECTAAALSDRQIDAVYSSDLMRAYNTVLPSATRRGLSVIPERGLREENVGDWEGKRVEEIIETYGELFTVDWIEKFGTFCPPNGESIPALGERIMDTLSRIGDENPGKTILIGCHAAAIRSFWGRAVGIAPEKLAEALPFPDNASYSEIDYEDGVFTPISYSESEHLHELITPITF